jgi:nucleotide-binding universal stress UspA family protein
MEIERILAPIDFSYRSRNELQWAISLAMRFRAELISLHVVPPEVVKNALEWKNETWEGMRADYSSQACQLVEEIEAEAPALGLDHSEVVVAGKPVEEILDAIRKLDIDLIVM